MYNVLAPNYLADGKRFSSRGLNFPTLMMDPSIPSDEKILPDPSPVKEKDPIFPFQIRLSGDRTQEDMARS
jgi:hypothetical protein